MTKSKVTNNRWTNGYQKPKNGNLNLGQRQFNNGSFNIVKTLTEKDYTPKPQRQRYKGEFIQSIIAKCRGIIETRIANKYKSPNEIVVISHEEIDINDNPTILDGLNDDLLVKRFGFAAPLGWVSVKLHQDRFNHSKQNNFYFYLTINGYENRVFEMCLKFQEKVSSCVYLAEDGRFLKIGKANDIKSREKSLKTANPLVKMMAVIEVDESIAIKTESEIKKKFKHLRHLGEWFNYHQSIIDYFGFNGRFL